MRKVLLSSVLSGLLFSALSAQSYNSSISFQKNQYTVAAVQIPADEDVVSAAVKDYMSRKGFRSAGYKDFLVFRSVPLDSDRNDLSDAYFSIGRKSRAEKDLTVVNLLPVKRDQTLLPANVDSSMFSSALAYLNDLKPYVVHYSIVQQIQAQQETVTKVETRIRKLKNDSLDIVSKIRSYESSLRENKDAQDKQATELQNISSGDHTALSKAHKKMDKLQDRQNDYEKKLRNAQGDADQNRRDLTEQQGRLDKESQVLDSLKKQEQQNPAPAL
jgi:hypothetical protein